MLSGGERRRLMLGAVVAQGANWLVLDEPTNQLDLDGREALERALEAFPGAVLLVSHDRALLDASGGSRRSISKSRRGCARSGAGGPSSSSQRELASASRHRRKQKAQRRRVARGASSALTLRAAGRARNAICVEVEEEISELEASLARLEDSALGALGRCRATGRPRRARPCGNSSAVARTLGRAQPSGAD